MTDYLADLDRGLAHLSKTREEYVRREAYQEGTISEVFGSTAVRKKLKATIDHYRLNFACTPVDSLIRRVKLAGVSIAGDNTPLAGVLAEIMDENELVEDLDTWMKRAAYLGDYYVLVIPTGDADVLDAEIVGRSPLSTAILYRTDNDRKPAFGLQKWSVAGKRVRVNLYYEDETYQMISAKGKTGDKAGDFAPLAEIDPETGDELDPSIPNELGFPLFHLRVDDKPYGRPVHLGAFGAQDAITKLVASHMGSVDAVGSPQRYALTDDDADDDAGEDFGDGEADQDGAVGGSKLAAGPGEVWWLKGVKSVGQFAAADPASFTDPLVFYIRAMGKATGTPMYEFDLDGAEPSGEARRRADGPINDHAATLKRSFGVTITRFLEYALAVRGHDDADVEVAWSPAEIVTDEEGWRTFALKVRNGVPLRHALGEVGYSDEQIAEWYPENDPAISFDAALALAEILAKLGQASAAGMVSPTDAATLFGEYLTAARPEAPADETTLAPLESAPAFADDEEAAAKILGAKFEALGVAVRAGVGAESAAAALKLEGIVLTGATPSSLRLPTEVAADLEAV